MDIGDLDLSRVDAVRGRGIVGVAKHLCGAATDLALRCLVHTHHAGSKVSGCGPHQESGVSDGTMIHGIAIALCCYHRCLWSELAGREFLEQLGFMAEEFHLISHMTSWAVCGQRPPGREAEGKSERSSPTSSKFSRILISVHYIAQVSVYS